MNKQELIEQLKDLRNNQKDFISNDDTGVFERDCEALDLACKILKQIDFEDLEGFRVCSKCGKLITEGFYNESEFKYYCSENCLHKDYTEEEYLELYDDGNGDFYWTEWEEE